MRSNTRALYTFASMLWAQSAEADHLSSSYESAEERITRESGAPVPARQRQWIWKLHEYESFWAAGGKSPRENTRDRGAIPISERRLGEWARYQRRFEAELSVYQRLRLDVSPAFQWDPQEAGWHRNFDKCAAHLRRTGQLPTLTANDPEQFAIARWLGRQLRHLRDETLTKNRAAVLKLLLSEAQRHN